MRLIRMKKKLFESVMLSFYLNNFFFLIEINKIQWVITIFLVYKDA